MIDFALFKEQMPLLFDQRYLEMSYLMREIGHTNFEKWVNYVIHFAHEDMPSAQKVPVDLAGACHVINSGRKDFSRWVNSSYASLSDDLWGQFWLAGVAAGLNYCNKAVLNLPERIGALIYAAAHLKRFCVQFNVHHPGKTIPLPVARILEEASREDYSLAFWPGKVAETQAEGYASPLIGREEELREIAMLLEDERLVTITGPGGIGKTRLSLAVTEANQDRFEDGAYFVSLVSINSTAAIIPTIANVIGFSFSEGSKPIDQLLEYIENQHMLLVLDNLEHLLADEHFVGTLALIERMLATCFSVKLLVTSRELLRLPQEKAFCLKGLAFRDAGSQGVSPDESAVTLFGERAQKVQENVNLADESVLKEIRKICSLVEGLPLAIELAAAQLRLFTPGEIYSELHNSLAVLDTGLRGTSTRHASMSAVFEASWKMLNSWEQAKFAGLSVFRGGFTHQAASKVAQVDLQTLVRLVDKSLIQKLGAGRFNLHPLIQVFAAEKLDTFPAQQVEVNGRHYHYFRDLLDQVLNEWRENSTSKPIYQLVPESENLVAGFQWILKRGDWDELAAFMEDMWQFFKVQGRFPEVIELFEQTYRQGQSRRPGPDTVHLAHWRRRIGQAYLWMSQLQQGGDNFQISISLVDQPLPSSRSAFQTKMVMQVLIQMLHRIFPNRVKFQDGHKRARCREAFVNYEQMAERALIENKNLLGLYCRIRSLNLSENTGEQSLMARAYATIGVSISSFGFNRFAEYYLRKASEIIQDKPILESHEMVLRYSGYYYASMGDHKRAEKTLLLAASQAGEIGRSWIQETDWTILLFLALIEGRLERALYFAQRIRNSASRRGDVGFEAAADYWEAAVKIEQNQLVDAITLLEQAAAAPQEVMNTLDWTIVHSAFAQAYLRQGQFGTTIEAAEQVMNIFSEIGRPTNGLFAYGFTSLADLYLRLWEKQPQEYSIQELNNSAHQACQYLDRFADIFHCTKPQALLYRGLCHYLDGHVNKANQAWQQSLNHAERLDIPFMRALAHYEIGRHLSPGAVSKQGWNADQHLRYSYEILTRQGAEYYCRQVENAMREANIPV